MLLERNPHFVVSQSDLPVHVLLVVLVALCFFELSDLPCQSVHEILEVIIFF